MEDYIKREQIGGVSPKHINTLPNLCIVGCTLHTSIHAMYCCYC